MARKADYAEFEKLNVKILGVAAVNSFSQKTFADSLKLPYPLLSDFPDMKVIRQYGVVHPSGIMANGMVFLVDTKRVVRARWPGNPTEVLPSDAILDVVRRAEPRR